MKIAEIFSFDWDGGRGRRGGSGRSYRRGDHYRSNYGYGKGRRYDRHNSRGLLGILG
ncbi:MAG: hypothetical protein ACT4NP_18045 [Pseudonocardiales bacterium]